MYSLQKMAILNFLMNYLDHHLHDPRLIYDICHHFLPDVSQITLAPDNNDLHNINGLRYLVTYQVFLIKGFAYSSFSEDWKKP